MKKSQVTVFIIIGIVILFTIGFLSKFFVANKGWLTDKTKGDVTRLAKDDKANVRNYVENCIEEAVPEGLEIMSLQGGFIDFPDDVDYVEVEDNEYVYSSNGLEYVKKGKGKNKVPFYLIDDNMSIPTIEHMESDLRDYVKKRIRVCVNNFKPFKDKDINVEYNDFDVYVDMNNTVNVKVYFPIKIKKGNITQYLDNFEYSLPINIGKILDYEIKLVLYEKFNHYLEDHAKSLISLYQYNGGEKESHSLPPLILVDTNLDCKYVDWTKQEVEDMLKDIFEKNM